MYTEMLSTHQGISFSFSYSPDHLTVYNIEHVSCMKQYVAYCVGNFFTFFAKNPLFWSDRFVFWFLYTAKFMIDIFFSVC